MSGRPILPSYQVITNASMAGNITSVVTIIQQLALVNYQFSWSGSSPVGMIKVQTSNDFALNADGSVRNAGTWSDYDTFALSGNTGNHQLNEDDIAAYAVRLVYIRTSGTGTLNAFINAKGSGVGVLSLNLLKGSLTLVGSGGIGITPSGTTITIDGSIDNLLPSQTGQSGKVLGTNGSAASWVTPPGGSASGIDGSVQFALSGAFVDDGSNFNWTSATHRLGLLTSSPSTTFHIASSSGSMAAFGTSALNPAFWTPVIVFGPANNNAVAIMANNNDPTFGGVLMGAGDHTAPPLTGPGGFITGVLSDSSGLSDLYIQPSGMKTFIGGLSLLDVGSVGTMTTAAQSMRIKLDGANATRIDLTTAADGGISLTATDSTGNADGHLQFEGQPAEFSSFEGVQGGEIRMMDTSFNRANFVAWKAPDTLSGGLTLTMPSADGSAGQVLTTNGSKVLSFTSITQTPVRIATGTVTLSATADYKLIANSGAGSFNINLPAGTDGLAFVLTKAAANSGTFTIVANGGDTLDSNVQSNFNANLATPITFKSGTWYLV